METVRDCSEQHQRLRRRVLVTSLATRKTFEMVLAVSLIRLNSKQKSKLSLVDNLIISVIKALPSKNPLASQIQSTHPEKKVEHPSFRKNALCNCALSQGAALITSQR